jgi:hypothetical protein
MRTLFYCALIILPLVTNQEKDSNLKERLGAKLEVETSVIKATKCIDNSGSDDRGRTHTSVRTDLTLRAVYKNVGKYPIILDKGCGTIGGQEIYHSLQNGKANQIEYDTNLEIFVMTEPPRREGDVPSSSFVILQPQEQYQGKAQTRLLIDYTEKYEHFSSGAHYLQFVIWTEDGTLSYSYANNLDELRARWKAIGYLWTEGATTKPMEMRFPKLGSIKKCK